MMQIVAALAFVSVFLFSHKAIATEFGLDFEPPADVETSEKRHLPGVFRNLTSEFSFHMRHTIQVLRMYRKRSSRRKDSESRRSCGYCDATVRTIYPTRCRT